MRKKASIMDMFLWAIIAFVATVMLVFWVFMISTWNTTFTQINQSVSTNDSVTLNTISDDTLGQVDSAAQATFPLIALAIIFGMIINIFVVNYLQKSNPVFFVVYWLVTIASFIVATYLSNIYEDLMAETTLGATFQSFTGASFVMLNLPIFVGIIGLVGGLFLFLGVTRDEQLGGGVV